MERTIKNYFNIANVITEGYASKMLNIAKKMEKDFAIALYIQPSWTEYRNSLYTEIYEEYENGIEFSYNCNLIDYEQRKMLIELLEKRNREYTKYLKQFYKSLKGEC